MMQRIDIENAQIPLAATYVAKRVNEGATPMTIYTELESQFDDKISWPGPADEKDTDKWEVATNAFDDTASNASFRSGQSFMSAASRTDIPLKYQQAPQRKVTTEDSRETSSNRSTTSNVRRPKVPSFPTVPEEGEQPREQQQERPWSKGEASSSSSAPPWKDAHAPSGKSKGKGKKGGKRDSTFFDRRGSQAYDNIRNRYHSDEVRRQAYELMFDMGGTLGEHWKDYVHIVYENNDEGRYYKNGKFRSMD